jgi:UPF0755 protein
LRRKLRITIASFVAFVLLYSVSQVFIPASGSVVGVQVSVEHGMSFRQAVSELADKGLVHEVWLFTLAGRLTGLDKRLRPGLYVFEGRQSTWSVFNTLRRGKVRLWSITISEGENLAQIRAKLTGKGIVNSADFDRLTHDEMFMARLGVNAPSLEGYLFPETYLFSRGIGPERVLSIMVGMTREVTRPLLVRAAEMGMDETELLAMASIIEKEARLDEERAIISGVYHNRLQKGIRLQADPTVVYGVKPLGKGITRSDLRRETPYNTYVIKGLPPGPIASPGRKSIEAAVAPEDVPYIFFVSNNDGSHVFTSTLREHNRAVKAYRVGRSIKNRKKNGPDS